jgi:GDPmannose 4,6-dehydratase
MWRMMQQKGADDYVIATGETYSVRDFLALAFKEVGISNCKRYVKIDEKLKRPADVHTLCGNPAKAKNVLGWKAKTKVPELVKIMVEADLERVKEERHHR